MRLTFLGTGTSSGVPMPGCRCAVCRSEDPRDRRLRCSALVSDGQVSVCIDAGPDFRAQMLSAGVMSLDAVVLTHEHTDHIMGLDDIRSYNYFARRPMDIWATPQVQRALRRVFSYAFEEPRYPGAPEMTLHDVEDAPFSIGSITLTPIHGRHYILPVTGYRIGDLAYLTDFNSISDDQVERLRGIRTLVVNALRREPHISHFCLSEAIELSRRIGAQRTYLTHLSHQMGPYAEVAAELPDGITMAYDGLSIEF